MDTSCADGQYRDGATCASCGPGRYSKSGDSTCSVCKPGTYSSEKSSSCNTCGKGTYSEEGFGACMKCKDGEYSGEGASSCMQCGVNMYGMDGECKKCENGTYSEPGATKCTVCKAGTYRSEKDEKCMPCPIGQYSKDGASSCTACGRGSILDDNQTSCTPCERNTTNEPGSNFCKPCPSGMFSEPGEECSSCKVGSYFSLTTKTCSQCEAGYIPNEEKTNCVQCGSNMTSRPGDTKCSPLDDTLVTCQSPAVKATGLRNNGKCITCPDYSSYNHDTGECDCDTGYTDTGSSCIEDPVYTSSKKQCPPNTKSGLNGICEIVCPEGQKLNSLKNGCIVPNGRKPVELSGLMQACEENSALSDGVCCPSNTFWNGTSCATPEVTPLVACGKNFGLQSDGSCRYTCPTGLAVNSDNNGCIIPIGKMPSKLDGIVEACEGDAILSKGVCCPPFKEWNGSACVDPYVANSNKIADVENVSTKCGPGQRMLANGSCVMDCPEGETANSTNDGCVKNTGMDKKMIGLGIAIAAVVGYFLVNSMGSDNKYSE